MDTPYIDYTDQMGGSVNLNHQVELKCATPDAEIYYTIDGSVPYPWHKSSKVGHNMVASHSLRTKRKLCSQ